MSELSIFVDESGHFDMTSKNSLYYIVSFVFHDQANDIPSLLDMIDTYTASIGYPNHFIHTEPIIRSEGVYETMPQQDRHKLFNALVHFARKSPIQYKSFFYKKKQYADKISMISARQKT